MLIHLQDVVSHGHGSLCCSVSERSNVRLDGVNVRTNLHQRGGKVRKRALQRKESAGPSSRQVECCVVCFCSRHDVVSRQIPSMDAEFVLQDRMRYTTNWSLGLVHRGRHKDDSALRSVPEVLRGEAWREW